MRYPDEVEIVKPRGEDAYGNPGRSWADPEIIRVTGFEVRPGSTLLLPASAPIEEGDRVRVRGRTYATEIQEVRSPSRSVLWNVTIQEVEGV